AVPVNRRKSPRWSCSSPPAYRATSRAPSPRSPAAVTSDRLATALNGVGLGLGTGTAASEPDSAGDECRLLAGKSTFVSREIPAHRRRGGPAHRRGGGSALASRLGLPACRFGAPRGRDGWTRVQARYLTSPPTTVMTTRVSRIASAWAKRASSEA